MTTTDEYLAKPYHVILLRDEWEDGTPGWFARVQELPGCMSQGRSPEEAVTRIYDAMRDWLDAMLADGKDIPEPRAEYDYSGRFLLRVPKSLHAALAFEAEREGVSVNQLVVSALSWFVGQRQERVVA